MDWFRKLRLRTKLLVGFGCSTALTVLLGTIAILSVRGIAAADQKLYDVDVVGLELAGSMESEFQQMRLSTAKVLFDLGATERDRQVADIRQHRARLDSLVAAYRASAVDSADKENVRQFTEALESQQRLIDEARAGRLTEGQLVMQTELVPAAKRGTTLLDAMTRYNEKGASDAVAANQAHARQVVWSTAAVLLIAVLAALGLGAFVSRLIDVQVGEVAERARRLQEHCLTSLQRGIAAMARGDASVEVVSTTEPLEVRTDDGLGALATTVNGMIDRCGATIQSYDTLRRTVEALIAETARLTAAARAGDLSARGDAAHFAGSYRALVEGMNDTIGAIVTPVREAATALERLAERDLTARVTGNFAGDHAAIQRAFNGAAEALERTLGQVSAASDQVASAADQITGGSQSLAEGASEQASSLEEISASLQELSAGARQSAANSREAATLSDAARTSAGAGAERMRALSEAMAQIKGAADQTARIVRTIDEIAFQTNLLALNAAVEAARAGDAGRGFAVVAEEVRSLAMRAAEAAKQTSALIEESGRQVEGGVALNEQVSGHLHEIQGHVERVAEVVGEISTSAAQQAQGIGQINTGVEQMNGVTQQVAANAEESAAAAEELASQAAHVRALVADFTLSTSGATSRPAAAPAPSLAPIRPAAPAPRRAPALRARTPRPAVAVAAELIPFDDDEESALAAF
jgi:methyl-accepting chemotaxis protein